MPRIPVQSLALVLLIVACGPKAVTTKEPLPFAPASPTASPDPAKMGPYPVGVMTYEGIFDYSRKDQWGNPRHLVTEVWYPAVEGARGGPGKVYSLEDLMTDQERTTVQMKGIKIPLDQTVAVEGAKPRVADGPFPMVVFSHGQAGIRWQSTFYTVALASHGYVVISPDHSGDTLEDAFALGDNPPLLNSFVERELDVAFLISFFSCMKYEQLVTDFKCISSTDFMAGMVNNDQNSTSPKFGVTGHSFGALTSLRAAMLDPRVTAIVPQAPTGAGEALLDLGAGDAVIKIPTLIEGAGDDHTLQFLDNAAEAYTQTSKPRALIDIAAGGHFTFSDLCQFNLGPVADQLGFVNVNNVITDGCGATSTPAAVSIPIMNNYAIGFFNWQLKGSVDSKKYLTQAQGDLLTPSLPHWKQACKAESECDPGQSCVCGIVSACSVSNMGTCQTVGVTTDF